MQAEYALLKYFTVHNMMPEMRTSLPDQVLDSLKYTKEVQIHPCDLKKTTFMAANLEP
jgi:hypothetical protein